ncbi:PilZ domain-containing protein [Pseudocolwellia sp. HL-MZ7]|uniref:PilZ domain-containing protein n=1 Tax=Pseudocolwellia sp. HL-MZ7 TaxID=3400627 RepID=UPI003CE88708
MNIDNRKHARVKPQSLTANITIFTPTDDTEIHLEGQVLDMSMAGIKIKLFSAMPENIAKSKIKIKINLLMPKSGLPVTIKGVIKRLDNDSECGIQYYKDHPDKEIDNLLFECIKSVQ